VLRFDDFILSAGERVLFKLPHLHLYHGAVALVGRNGSGKSTFIRAILGEHNDYHGRIQIQERALHGYKKEELAKLVAVVYTRPHLFGNHTVSDVLMLGRLPYQGMWSLVSESDRLVVYRVAAQLEIEHLLNRTFVTLSDGEKQLVMIGRALVQDTPILLMDEPAAFLDIVHRHKLVSVMKSIISEGNKLVVFSTHHTDFLGEFCYNVLIIDNGEMSVFHEPLNFERDIQRTFFPEK